MYKSFITYDLSLYRLFLDNSNNFINNVPSEIIKVVHDDSNEQIEDKEGTHNEERDEEGIGDIATASPRLSSVITHWITDCSLAKNKRRVNCMRLLKSNTTYRRSL